MFFVSYILYSKQYTIALEILKFSVDPCFPELSVHINTEKHKWDDKTINKTFFVGVEPFFLINKSNKQTVLIN